VAGGPANLSDDIYRGCGGNSLDGDDLSVKRERTATAAGPAPGRAITSEAAAGDEEESPSPPVTSTQPPQGALFASDLTAICRENIPADSVVRQSPTVEGSDVSHSVAQTFMGEESQEVAGLQCDWTIVSRLFKGTCVSIFIHLYLECRFVECVCDWWLV